jgi:hypothetical protein
MDREYNMHGEGSWRGEEKTYKVMAGKPEGKGSMSGCCEDIIKRAENFLNRRANIG